MTFILGGSCRVMLAMVRRLLLHLAMIMSRLVRLFRGLGGLGRSGFLRLFRGRSGLGGWWVLLMAGVLGEGRTGGRRDRAKRSRGQEGGFHRRSPINA